MGETGTKESLELEVTDFGPIVEAKLDLRPFTVFIGPSNTGKSYLAILIYALHRFLGEAAHLSSWRYRSGLRVLRRRGSREISDESISALLAFAQSLEVYSKPRHGNSLTLPFPVAEAVRSGFDELAGVLRDKVGRCFGIVEAGTLSRKGRRSPSRIVMRQRIAGQPEPVEHRVSLTRQAEFRTVVPADFPIPVDFDPYEKLGLFVDDRILDLSGSKTNAFSQRFAALDFLSRISDFLLPSLFGPLHRPVWYLPADRTGVMHAHSVVVSALIARAPTAGLRPDVRTPMLSGILADFLEQLVQIDRYGRPRRRRTDDLAAAIEKNIMEGSIHVQRSEHIDYPRFVYRPEGWKGDLALANASSMVSELAPVVLYLRHLVEPGHVLIVEEPESHLHPAMQVAFTRELAALVKAGIRVIVTTHSEWLLEELANIVGRWRLPKEERGGKIALDPAQVGAWLFEPRKRPKGSVVKQIRLDDSGLYPTGYDEVAAALHNDWAEIASGTEAGS